MVAASSASRRWPAGYPAEPAGSWPTDEFPSAPAPGRVADLVDEAVASPSLAETRAVVVLVGGAVVAERYGGALPSFVSDPLPVGPETPLLSWSMAKSILGLLVAQLVDDGLLGLDDALEVPEWPPGDPRSAITLEHALEMRDGLDFAEDYVDDAHSDVIEMLYGAGAADVAAYAASRPLAHRPGERFSYSSGTSNLISRHLGLRLGGTAAMRSALSERIFEPCAMGSAEPGFDEAGTFVASSYVHATARDWARLGLMLCRGGVAQGRRLVAESWVDRWRTPASHDEEGYGYSAHFWAHDDEFGTFYLAGFEGQSVVVCPPLDLVIVRLGSTPHERKEHLMAWRRRLIEEVAASAAPPASA
jgi:CubicO group peptidase (beta-lactamase class C family)